MQTIAAVICVYKGYEVFVGLVEALVPFLTCLAMHVRLEVEGKSIIMLWFDVFYKEQLSVAECCSEKLTSSTSISWLIYTVSSSHESHTSHKYGWLYRLICLYWLIALSCRKGSIEECFDTLICLCACQSICIIFLTVWKLHPEFLTKEPINVVNWAI